MKQAWDDTPRRSEGKPNSRQTTRPATSSPAALRRVESAAPTSRPRTVGVGTKKTPRPTPTTSEAQRQHIPIALPPTADEEPILEMPPIASRRTSTAREVAANAAPAPIKTPPARRSSVEKAPSNVVRTFATPEPELLAPGVCATCRGAGYVRKDVPMGHPAFGKAVPCECKKLEIDQRRREMLWKLSSLDAFQEMTFETFNPRVQGTREAWDAAKAYADDPEGWLILSGPCGSGKTHLAASIANMLFEQGWMVLFTVVPKLLDHLRAAFAPTSDTTYDALFEKVCDAGLLVLDDLGAEHTTPWAQEKLFQIINHRYMYQLPTVITTNLELINDLDDRVRSRMRDVSLVNYVNLKAVDYRPHHTPTRSTPTRQGRS